MSDHVCFGCGKPIVSMQEHIHVGLGEWAAREGLPPLGIDLPFAFCVACTRDDPDGWKPEAHAIDSGDAA